MNCTKCGKEIPDGENKLCKECQNELISEIEENANKEESAKKTKEKNKILEKIANKFEIKKEKFDKKNIKSKIIFLIITVLIILFTIFIINLVAEKNIGNTIGNIRNYGYAKEKDGWMYYLSPNEDSSKIGIYKIKLNKKDAKPQELQVKDWDVLSLNVAKNYLYFIAISPEAYNEEDAYDNKIYRMKTDGSELEVINDNEFNDKCYEIYVINNKIYYIGTDSNIYKMNTDGTNRELVSDNETGYLGITDKYIVYNVATEDGTDYVTHIMDLNGKNTRPILENTRLYSINIDGDYIYYTNQKKQICKVKIDGTQSEIICETTAYNMNTSGKYIYYLNYVDEESENYKICIYRVRKDGKTETPEIVKKLDTVSDFINIVGNWIIYMDYNSKEGFINLVKTDGSEEKRLYTLNYEKYYSSVEIEETTDTQSQTIDETNTNEVVSEGNSTSADNALTTESKNEAVENTNVSE